jgi:hypothetical protein
LDLVTEKKGEPYPFISFLIIQKNSIICLRNRWPSICEHSSVQVQHANKVVNSQGSTVIWKRKSHGTVIKGAIVTEVESMLVGKGNVEQVECMVFFYFQFTYLHWCMFKYSFSHC